MCFLSPPLILLLLCCVEEIMPNFFSTSKMSSFQRQLNLYGFQRIDDGPEKGGFVHQFFQKGRRSMCNRIKRQRGRTQRTAHSALILPNVQPTAVGRGGPPRMGGNVQRFGPATDAIPLAAAAPSSMPPSQQAQQLLLYLLSQPSNFSDQPSSGGYNDIV